MAELNGTAPQGMDGGSADGNAGGDADHGSNSNRGARGVGAEVMPIPASIVRAIAQIKATVDAVKKTGFNDHGRYKFSSTDDIYAALSRKMGEVGIICMALEDRCEIKRVEKPAKEKGTFARDKDGNIVTETVQWAHVEYAFVWATETDTWTDPRAKRTIYIQVTGPQTFQGAQSFVEKAYLRSTFKLPSGDMDLDSMPQADNEDDQVSLARQPKNKKSSAEGKRDGSVKIFNQIRSDISTAINSEMLLHVRDIYAAEWAEMPSRWAEMLEEEFATTMDGFLSQQAAE